MLWEPAQSTQFQRDPPLRDSIFLCTPNSRMLRETLLGSCVNAECGNALRDVMIDDGMSETKV